MKMNNAYGRPRGRAARWSRRVLMGAALVLAMGAPLPAANAEASAPAPSASSSTRGWKLTLWMYEFCVSYCFMGDGFCCDDGFYW